LTDDDKQKTDGRLVYKQTLKNAKLQIGKRGQNTAKSIKEAEVRM